MRALSTTVVGTLLCLAALAHARAQNAVLLLTPGPTTSVVAGIGKPGFAGDGSAATTASFAAPTAVAQDTSGNLYVADTRNHRIRKIASNGTISTIAGTGVQGFSGDAGPALSAQLDSPSGIALGASGAIYIADTRNHRVRKIDSSGTISTVAGPDSLTVPQGLALSAAGDLYIADPGSHRVRRLAADGTATTFAGTGVQGDSGDGGPATSAALNAPTGLVFRSDGALLIADRGNNRVRVVTAEGVIQPFDTVGLQLRRPTALALNAAQELLIADTGNFRIGQISTSGAGTALGSGVQGALATAALPSLSPLGAPVSLAADASGNFVALDQDNAQAVGVGLPAIRLPDTVIATTGQSRTLTLRNGATTPLRITAVSIPAGFTLSSSTCGAAPFSLAGSASCTLSLALAPSREGLLSGTLEVTVAGAATQRVLLSGTGVRTGTLLASSTTLQTNGSISYAGASLVLTALVLGSSTPTPGGNVTFLDGAQQIGTVPLNSTAQASLTTRSLAAGTHTLTARFLGDAIYSTSTSLSTQQTVVLPPDFTLTATSTTRVTVNSGAAGAMMVTLQPSNGVLNSTVTLQADGLPTGTTLNLSPNPVTLASDPVPVTITFKLPVAVSSVRHTGFAIAAALLLPFLFCRAGKRIPTLAALLALTALQGCGGGFSGNGSSVSAQSSTQTYPVTITATTTGVTGDTLTHSASFTVVVQP